MKLFKFLFSGWFMGVLLIVFAYAIGYATFVENDSGPVAARLVVYNTTWFEIILLLMVINFTGMIFTKQLYLKSKLNILLIHVALIVIIIGAGVTRYFSFEGQMHIREGQTSNIFRSADTYLQVQLAEGDQIKAIDEKIMLAPGINNLFSNNYNWQDNTIKISVDKFLPNAHQVMVNDNSGAAYIALIVGQKNGRLEIGLKDGESTTVGDLGISLNDTTNAEYLQIINKGDSLFVRIPPSLAAETPDEEQINAETNVFQKVRPMTVLKAGNTSFVIKHFTKSGSLQYEEITDNSVQGTPVIKVKINDQELMIPRGKQEEIMLNNTRVIISIGNRMFQLPYSLKLNEFDLERYPGSNSPSSFASEVTVIDEANSIEMPYRIYMNHILNYGGYRFFQSSYDQDEKGTVLSVNHDYWGTLISYIGYFLLFGSLILSFFTRGTRFARISQQLRDVHLKRKTLTIPVVIILMVLSASQNVFAQAGNTKDDHTEKFGQLFVQNNAGRIEPVNTIANKILVKISKRNSYNNLSANEVFLGIVTDPQKWQQEPIIKVAEAAVQSLLGITGDYATFMDFVNDQGQYKISTQVNAAQIKKPALRSTLDKALINVDERFNVFYKALNGGYLKIFPIENDPDNKWATPKEYHDLKGHGTDEGDIFEGYLQKLEAARASNNYQEANKVIARINRNQALFAGAILPSATKVKFEVFYNKINIFKTLFPVYLVVGILLVAIFFLQTFKPSLEFKLISKILLWVLIISFVAQTFGLAIRWYISGHAPWSNGFESMIYIAWASILAGFMFMKRSSVTLGVAAILAGITLLTAHMSWLNPELTNLVPVLKSYWLTIHVATITASYGFLALGCMVGFLNMGIMIFKNNKNQFRVNLTLKELSLIIEMSLSVGLVLLVIGNFLGGIWANESWGRYWGWDPKETWTLVTIILYSFTLHLTLIPSIRSTFTFSFLSFVSFGTVLMTYFGVNFYLSGLHSYANGDPVQVPTFVYYTLIIVGIVSVLAAYKEYQFDKPKEEVNPEKIAN
jgi:cytochrome c-type biogenesis protein CcsB